MNNEQMVETAVPMRLAMMGKGGVGKSMISGTLTRILARRGHRILAMDVDTMPGLAQSLGLSNERAATATIPPDFDEHQEGRGWVLKDGVDVADLVADYSIVAPDDIRYLQLGKLPNHVKQGSTTAFRAVLNEYRPKGWTLVGDLAAGTRQPFFGWGKFAQIVLIVVEPSAKATLSVRRLAQLSQRPFDESTPLPFFGLVINKIRSDEDAAYVQQALAGTPAATFPLLGTIPYDEEVAAVERLGQTPIDVVPNAAAVLAIKDLATRLEQETAVW